MNIPHRVVYWACVGVALLFACRVAFATPRPVLLLRFSWVDNDSLRHKLRSDCTGCEAATVDLVTEQIQAALSPWCEVRSTGSSPIATGSATLDVKLDLVGSKDTTNAKLEMTLRWDRQIDGRAHILTDISLLPAPLSSYTTTEPRFRERLTISLQSILQDRLKKWLTEGVCHELPAGQGLTAGTDLRRAAFILKFEVPDRHGRFWIESEDSDGERYRLFSHGLNERSAQNGTEIMIKHEYFKDIADARREIADLYTKQTDLVFKTIRYTSVGSAFDSRMHLSPGGQP